MDIVTDGVFGRRFHFDLITGWKECVEPGNEKGMAFKQFRYSIDHSGRVDAGIRGRERLEAL